MEAISFSYPGGVQALREVNLTLQPGEMVALLGANGSGKSTLARTLNGLLRPTLGKVWVGDWVTTQHSPAQMARRVAYVFQNPDEQLFCQRVWDEVAFGPRNLGFSAKQVGSQVEQALEDSGLREFAQHNPRDLGFSGRKMVALASALAMNTPVLVLDEPGAGLDAGEVQRLSQRLNSLHEQGKTLLVISHDMDFVAENFKRLVLLSQGTVLLDAPVQAFFKQQAVLEAAGLVLPQMVRLSEKLGHPHLALNVEQFLEEQARLG
jgi:energy-coupling factor transport system ATP-binding protein